MSSTHTFSPIPRNGRWPTIAWPRVEVVGTGRPLSVGSPERVNVSLVVTSVICSVETSLHLLLLELLRSSGPIRVSSLLFNTPFIETRHVSPTDDPLGFNVSPTKVVCLVPEEPSPGLRHKGSRRVPWKPLGPPLVKPTTSRTPNIRSYTRPRSLLSKIVCLT